MNDQTPASRHADATAQARAAAAKLAATTDALAAALAGINGDTVDAVLSEPSPRIWPGEDNTLRTLRLDGEVTLRDALDVEDGQDVVFVVTARISRRDKDYGTITSQDIRATVTSVDIADGRDIVSGPSSDVLFQEQKTARDLWEARRQTALDIKYPQLPMPRLTQDDPSGDRRRFLGILPRQRDRKAS